MATKRKYPEHELQKSCIKWFRLKFPKEIIFAIPNAGKVTVIQGARLNQEGLLKGIPDLFIAHGSIYSNGLFIEMKAEKGHLSIVQVNVIDKLRLKNYEVRVCHSFDEFQLYVNEYFKTN